MVAWVRAIYQYHVNGTDTVGQSVNTHVPVDHTSVGLTQARPNYSHVYSFLVHILQGQCMQINCSISDITCLRVEHRHAVLAIKFIFSALLL